jgi:type I restriction enzyme, S subunit
MGDVCMIPEGLRCCLGQRQVLIRPDEAEIDGRYLVYAIQSSHVQRQIAWNEGTGSTVSNLRIPALEALKIPTPTLPIQRQISTTLGALDDRIELLRQTNETLEAIAHALFQSWFVDFDPVRAKSEGRRPEGMDDATAALFPDSFEDSPMGLLPSGWSLGNLGSLASLNPESWSNSNHPEFIRYVDLANVKANRLDITEPITFSDAPSRARRVLRDGDTVVGTVRPGNRSFSYIHGGPENLTGSTGFAVLRPRNPADAGFVYLGATKDSSIEQLAHSADGGAYPAVRPDVVASLGVTVPPRIVLDRFGAMAVPLLEKIRSNEKQAALLANVRDALLPRLISGQLQVPDTGPDS